MGGYSNYWLIGAYDQNDRQITTLFCTLKKAVDVIILLKNSEKQVEKNDLIQVSGESQRPLNNTPPKNEVPDGLEDKPILISLRG